MYSLFQAIEKKRDKCDMVQMSSAPPAGAAVYTLWVQTICSNDAQFVYPGEGNPAVSTRRIFCIKIVKIYESCKPYILINV